MKFTLVTLCLLWLGFCSDNSELSKQSNLSVGKVITINRHLWVYYIESGIRQKWSNATTYSQIGDLCYIGTGDRVKILNIVSTDSILVKLVSPIDGEGTRCESNMNFYLSKCQLLNEKHWCNNER